MPEERFEEFSAQKEIYLSRGSFGWITVVAATTFMPAPNWPNDPIEQARCQGQELDKALSIFNEYLVSLSLMRHDPLIRPIARGDLPFLCHVILETVPMPTGTRNAAAFPYQIHEINRHRHAARPVSDTPDDEELLSFQMFMDAHLKGEPHFLFYELMQQAIGSFNESRFRMTAMLTGTAVEVLLTTLIRLAGIARGETPERIESILNSPLRNQVEHHVQRLIGCDVDLDDPVNSFGRWWTGGYRLRNRVLHDGVTPSREEARCALDDALDLVVHLKTGLLSDAVTRDLGEATQWGPLRQSTPGDAASP